jgi:arginine exporter protein ArgO
MLGHQLVFAAFLLAQILDGVLTYVGVSVFGVAAEGNPILAWLMTKYGEAFALASAKVVAALCGVALYVLAVDRLLAALTLVYVGAAIIPWTLVLF